MSTGEPTTYMVALAPNGHSGYTTNISAKTVTAIEVPAKTGRATFQVGQRIEALAVTPDGREVWVSGNDSHAVYVLNGQTGGIEHTLQGFGMAYRVSITPDGRTAVISDPVDEKIHLFDVASHRPKAVINVPPQDANGAQPSAPSSPQGISISRDGTTAFVTLNAAQQVAVVDIASAKITSVLPAGAERG